MIYIKEEKIIVEVVKRREGETKSFQGEAGYFTEKETKLVSQFKHLCPRTWTRNTTPLPLNRRMPDQYTT